MSAWLGRIGTQVQVAGRPVFPFSIEVAAHGWEGVVQCAMVALNKSACLVIQGNSRHLSLWQHKAGEMGISNVLDVVKIPMDRRHASKIDRKALAKLIAS